MKQYLIFLCQKCGSHYYCKAGQKTKICTKCGHRIQLKSARILAHADSPLEARFLVEAYKVPESKRQEFIDIMGNRQAQKPLKNKEILEHFITEHVHKKNEGSIAEDQFFRLLNEKGLPNEWIERELEILIRQGLVIRPRKGMLKFII